MLPERLPLDLFLAFSSRVLWLCACSVGNDRTSSLFHIFIYETRTLIAYSSPLPCRPSLSPCRVILLPIAFVVPPVALLPLAVIFLTVAVVLPSVAVDRLPPLPTLCHPSPTSLCCCPCRANRRRRCAVALVVPSVVVPSVALVVPPVAQQSAACSLTDSKRCAFAGAPAAGCHGLCRFVCDRWRSVGRSTYFTYSHVGYLKRQVFIPRK